jgi:hypothetical protein
MKFWGAGTLSLEFRGQKPQSTAALLGIMGYMPRIPNTLREGGDKRCLFQIWLLNKRGRDPMENASAHARITAIQDVAIARCCTQAEARKPAMVGKRIT